MVARDELREDLMKFALRNLRGEGSGEELAILPQILELIFGSYF